MVALAVLGVFFGGVVELGGDSFDLVEIKGENAAERGLKVYRNEFRGGGLGGPEDMSETEINELNQQIAAGEGQIVKVAGLKIKGKTHWSIGIRRINQGEPLITSRQPVDPPTQITPFHLDFYNTEVPRIERDIEDGVLSPSGRQIMIFDGLRFQVDFWIIESEKLGEVTYYKGVPIR